MKYNSEECVIGGQDRVGNPFDDTTFSRISKAVDRIQQMSNEMDYIAVLKYNLEDFNCGTSTAGADGRGEFIRQNCSFSNFLNSFYTWKWYHKRVFETSFLRLLEQHRKKHVAYRLGERLRNYTTHKGFAITDRKYDVIREYTYYFIKPRELLEWEDPDHRLNATLKNWLIEQDESRTPINACTFATEFFQICRDIQGDFWSKKKQQVHNDLLAILAILPDCFSNIYNVSISSEDRSVHISIGQIIAQFLKKAAYQYPEFIPDSYIGRF